MDVNAARDLVKLRIGNRVDTALDTQVVAEMALAQTVLEGGSYLPWFLLSEFSENDTVADEERVPVPTDFLREFEYGSLYYNNSALADAWVELLKDEMEALRADTTLNASTGAPQKYSLVGDYFRLFPTPDAVYTLKMVYYKQDTAPATGGAENLWLKWAPDWLIAQTCVQMAQNLQMPQARVEKFMHAAQIAERRTMVAGEAREHASREYVMGGPDA